MIASTPVDADELVAAQLISWRERAGQPVVPGLGRL